MKHTLLSILSVIALLSFTASCAKKDVKPEVSNNNLSHLPSWVLDPEIDNGIAAIGIANPSKGGLKFQIPEAEVNARASIAAIIRSEVSRVTKNALRSANVNGNNDVEDFFTQASKEVIKNIPLSGVKRIKGHIFKANDGTLYIHMALKDEDYRQFLENSQMNLETSLQKSQLSRDNINKSQEASKAIFDELDRERNAN